MRWSLLPLVVLAAACNNRQEYDIVEKPVVWAVLVQLDTQEARAGDAIGYTVTLFGDDESVLVPERWTLSSDLDEVLEYNPDDLVPHLSGQHEITATVQHEGEALTGLAILDVDPGPPHWLDLELTEYATWAGAPLGWTLEAADLYGNPIDTSGLEPVPDSVDVVVSPTEVAATVPGIYTLTVESEGAWDEEAFVVAAGPAAYLDLELATTELELNDSTVATVTVTDAWGNEAEDPWEITASGGSVDIGYTMLTFREEGWITVTASLLYGSLSDSVGPILVDSTGPEIVMDEPERGDWVEGDSSTVSGHVTEAWSGIASVDVNGTAVTLDGSGDFSTAETWDFGTNVVETTAVDGDGNVSTDTRALLAGDFETYGSGIADGIVARIQEGSGGLDTLEAIGEDLVSSTDLDDLIPSPVYSNEEEDCVDLGWFGTYCFTWYSVDLYVTNPSLGTITLDLDPQSSGLIKATVVAYDPSLDWSGSGVVAEIGYSGSGDITADYIKVVAYLDLYVDTYGDIHVDVDSTSVSTSNFDFDMDGWLYDVIDFFGVPVDSWIQGYMEDALEDAIQDELPPALEDLLQDLELATDIPLEGRTYTLDAVPADIDVDSTGITLFLDTWFEVDRWTSPYTGLGSLYYGYSTPSWTGASGMTAGFSADFLNQALLAFWGGGLLDQSLGADDIGLDPADLQVLFPAMDDLLIETEALLPPVVVPSTSGLLELQLGDYHITLTDPTDGQVMLEVYTSIFADLDVDIAADGTTLSAELGTPDLYFDVIQPEANTLGAADTEALLEALVPLLMPTLTDALGEIPIPSIDGFALDNVGVSLGGAEGGYVDLTGDLEVD